MKYIKKFENFQFINEAILAQDNSWTIKNIEDGTYPDDTVRISYIVNIRSSSWNHDVLIPEKIYSKAIEIIKNQNFLKRGVELIELPDPTKDWHLIQLTKLDMFDSIELENSLTNAGIKWYKNGIIDQRK